MKNILIIIFCLWLVGCETKDEREERQAKEIPELVLSQISLSHGIYRLENSEVVCYYRYEASIECKFKGEK